MWGSKTGPLRKFLFQRQTDGKEMIRRDQRGYQRKNPIENGILDSKKCISEKGHLLTSTTVDSSNRLKPWTAPFWPQCYLE